MTTSIKVSVNGNYKIPVKQGDNTVWVSGRDHDGPREATFYPTHGDGAAFQIGPEEPDSGDDMQHAGEDDVMGLQDEGGDD